MDLTLSDVEHILRSELGRFRASELYKERWEDGIQEGLIRAWKDMDERPDLDDWHRINRAKLWAKAYIMNSDGRRHMTGHAAVSRCHTNPHIKPMLTDDGHIDHHAYEYHSLNAAPVETSIPLHGATGTPSFEDDLLADLTFQQMISGLSLEDRQVMYMHHVIGNTHQEMADFLGVKFSNTATRRIKRAHANLKEAQSGTA